MMIMGIVSQGEISRRTAYRYKAYYDALKRAQSGYRKGKTENRELRKFLTKRKHIKCIAKRYTKWYTVLERWYNYGYKNSKCNSKGRAGY